MQLACSAVICSAQNDVTRHCWNINRWPP